MPNWCKGTLKVRGNVIKLRNFVSNSLLPVSYCGEEHPPIQVVSENGDLTFYAHVNGDTNISEWFWLESTNRHFVEPGEILVEAQSLNEQLILALPFEAAWDINAHDLWRLCIQHGIDMKITGFEKGAQIQREVEIVGGIITLDSTIRYKDYEWECPCPLLGG